MALHINKFPLCDLYLFAGNHKNIAPLTRLQNQIQRSVSNIVFYLQISPFYSLLQIQMESGNSAMDELCTRYSPAASH
jgi:hypothetical protein